ncbi:hypothetical protein BJ912DRAFT_188358 [Pholiota molesta]|nr:hypothetical protein BJ912DRAFT_188358 [Pholiota molesta]
MVDDTPDTLSAIPEPIRETKRVRLSAPPKQDARLIPGSALSSEKDAAKQRPEQRETDSSLPKQKPPPPKAGAPRADNEAPAVAIAEAPKSVPAKPVEYTTVQVHYTTIPTDTILTKTTYKSSVVKQMSIRGGKGEYQSYALAGQSKGSR